MAIPQPSEQDWAEKDSESFMSDPEELWDRLPQPYRMIDKVLDRLLGAAWESILKREAARGASQQKHPYLMLSADTQVHACTSFVCLLFIFFLLVVVVVVVVLVVVEVLLLLSSLVVLILP